LSRDEPPGSAALAGCAIAILGALAIVALIVIGAIIVS
jgi:hypothetical protein